MGNRAYLSIFVKKERFDEGFIKLHQKAINLKEELRTKSREETEELLDGFIKHTSEYGYNVESMRYFAPHLMPLIVPLDFFMFEGEEYACNFCIQGQYPNSRLEKKNLVPKEWATLFNKGNKQEFEEIIIGDTTYKVRERDYVTNIKQAISNIKNTDLETDHPLEQWLSTFPEDSLVTLNYSELFLNDYFNEDSFLKYLKVS